MTSLKTPDTPKGRKWTAQEINQSGLTPLEASKLLVYTLPPNVDPTKMQLAYGRRAIPKLVTEIPEGSLQHQQKSLVFLAELLHNPLNISQALKRDLDHAVGRAELIKHDTLHALLPLVGGLLPKDSFKKLPEERMDIQIMILDTLYNCIRLGRAPYIPDEPIKCDAMGAFTQILKNESVAETKVAASKCIMMLSFHKICKTLACQGETTSILISMLSDRKSAVRAAAAGALMSITIDVEAKKMFVRDDAVSTLMELLGDANESVILNVIKVITNVAEDYRGRFELHACVKKVW
ncbi:Radial spoke head 14 [Physocladia obscura]|uniref:Radial spoke head 14 n=1 Tax=Physocladia obscura TaxID=109957 RepID=A0AAD5XHH9_9FUNG|nr:Radial spoke head 14 [Physocladia obscura]